MRRTIARRKNLSSYWDFCGQAALSSSTNKVLLGFLWQNVSWFEVEFSEFEESSNTIMFKDPNASRCGLDCLSVAVESF